MIDNLKTLIGLTGSNLPYFTEQILTIFTLMVLFFGAIVFLNGIFDMLFSIFRKER